MLHTRCNTHYLYLYLHILYILSWYILAVVMSDLQRRNFILTVCVLVIQPCPTLCDCVACSMPGFPVFHPLLQFAKLMSILSVMSPIHLIFCCPPFLQPSIFPSIRVNAGQCLTQARIQLIESGIYISLALNHSMR